MDIPTILKDLYYCDFNLQAWINHRFQDPSKLMIERSVVDHITTPEGLKFYPFGCDILNTVLSEVRFDDLKPDDIVLDLGANIGGFALRAAQKCKHVYAVEPLFDKELCANVALNNLQDKITVLPFGVGNGEKIPIKYYDRIKTIQTYPLHKILEMTGPISFLKCDIEGTEWTIRPEELAGIPRMEFEVHLGPGHSGENLDLLENPGLIRFIHQNWNTEIIEKTKPSNGCYIHAYPK